MRAVTTEHTRPVWAEISSGALLSNYNVLRSAAGEHVDVLAVVKADAYGHGARECAPVLAAAGAHWLGVTSVEEGVSVRQSLGILPQGMGPRVLVMCGLWAGEEAAIIDRGLTPVVWEPFHLQLLEDEARRRGMPPGSLAVHAEIDTGMARQGVAPGDVLTRLLQRFTSSSPLRLEGVLTHMASAECAGDAQNAAQWNAFAAALDQVRDAGLRPDWVHVGNTSGVDSGAVAATLPGLANRIGARAMTRAGLALYGYALPLQGTEPRIGPRVHAALHPVMTWKTRVVSIREVPEGATIGYNATFVAQHAMRLALLPVGYADGLRRALSSTNEFAGGSVLLRGARVPVVGRVSMDLTIVDVTPMPDVLIGEEVELLGPHISAEEHAQLARTSAYEVLCGISDRVPRVVME